MQHSSISKKVYIPLFILLAVVLVIVILLGMRGAAQIKTDIYEQFRHRITLYYAQELSEKEAIGVSNAISLAYNDNLKTAHL